MDNKVDATNSEKKVLRLDIFRASQVGDLERCKEIIRETGSQVLHDYDEKGHTALHWACLAGHNEIVKFFIACNAPLDKGSNNELAPKPIHWACVNGHIVTVDILLQHGVSVDSVDNRQCTPLILATQYGKAMLVGYLIGKGSRKELTDVDGDNALHWAAFKGYSEIVQLLLYNNFGPTQKDDVGQVPLHLACLSGSLATVKLLAEQEIDFSVVDNNGKSPLDLAIGRDYKDIVFFMRRRLKMENIFGSCRRLFNIIAGEKKFVVFYLLALFGFSYPIYIYYFTFLWNEAPTANVIFLSLTFGMWFSFYKASKSDPGSLPCNTDEYEHALKQVALHKEWETSSEKNPLNRLCHTCRLVRPIRSKHCRICNRCVRYFDHHCHFIHNCIGPRNRVVFLVFFVITIIECYLAVYLAVQVLRFFPFNIFHFLFLFLYAFFAPMFTCILFLMLLQTSFGLTTNERINAGKYSYLRDASGAFYNPFNRGFVLNWLEFLNLIPEKRLDIKEGEMIV